MRFLFERVLESKTVGFVCSVLLKRERGTEMELNGVLMGLQGLDRTRPLIGFLDGPAPMVEKIYWTPRGKNGLEVILVLELLTFRFLLPHFIELLFSCFVLLFIFVFFFINLRMNSQLW